MRIDPIPAQTNTRALDVVARADGSPITAGTVNYYLVALTGANAGKWFKHSDQTWNVAETVCLAMTHKADGHWLASDVHADGWIDGVEYVEYAKESGDLHVPVSHTFVCRSRITLAAIVASILADVSITGDGATTLSTILDELHACATGNIAKVGDAYTFRNANGDVVYTLTIAAASRTRS